VLQSCEDKYATTWSPDGRFLLCSVLNPKTKSDIWVLPMVGDKKSVPFLVTEFAESGARFSPDAHWVAYVSNESGRQLVNSGFGFLRVPKCCFTLASSTYSCCNTRHEAQRARTNRGFLMQAKLLLARSDNRIQSYSDAAHYPRTIAQTGKNPRWAAQKLPWPDFFLAWAAASAAHSGQQFTHPAIPSSCATVEAGKQTSGR
jgi:dipeptidyl aminopeptidase/acylaminoacyl peptidase